MPVTVLIDSLGPQSWQNLDSKHYHVEGMEA